MVGDAVGCDQCLGERGCSKGIGKESDAKRLLL